MSAFSPAGWREITAQYAQTQQLYIVKKKKCLLKFHVFRRRTFWCFNAGVSNLEKTHTFLFCSLHFSWPAPQQRPCSHSPTLSIPHCPHCSPTHHPGPHSHVAARKGVMEVMWHFLHCSLGEQLSWAKPGSPPAHAMLLAIGVCPNYKV